MLSRQPAISRHIVELERNIGVPLFERNHRIVVRTPLEEVFHRTVTLDILTEEHPSKPDAQHHSTVHLGISFYLKA